MSCQFKGEALGDWYPTVKGKSEPQRMNVGPILGRKGLDENTTSFNVMISPTDSWLSGRAD